MSDKSLGAVAPHRWWQLIAGIICMVMIANLQYGWTLFVAPMSKAQGWSVTDIQLAFSIFIALETWLTPVEGWIVDLLGPTRGPKIVVAAGGILVALGWILNSQATSLEALYVGAALTGAGGGAVYATCVGSAVKWFPDRRGLAVGLTAAGFGAGAALTVIPIRTVIAASGYQRPFSGSGWSKARSSSSWLGRSGNRLRAKCAAPRSPRSSRPRRTCRRGRCWPRRSFGCSTSCSFWSRRAA